MISLSISFNPHHYSPCTCSLWNPKLKILQLGIATWSRTYKSRESNTEFCNPYGNNKKQIEWYLTLSFLPPVLDRVAPGDKKKKKPHYFPGLKAARPLLSSCIVLEFTTCFSLGNGYRTPKEMRPNASGKQRSWIGLSHLQNLYFNISNTSLSETVADNHLNFPPKYQILHGQSSWKETTVNISKCIKNINGLSGTRYTINRMKVNGKAGLKYSLG